MNRTILGACVVMLLGACVTPDYAYEVDGPPPEVVTTEDPVYYGGVSLYWYSGAWMFRGDDGRWMRYTHEVPASVPHANVHVNAAPRKYYGQGGYRGTAAPRSSGHAGGGGHGRR